MLTVMVDILTDAVILILPAPLLKELNVHPLKKLCVMLLMCSGLFVIGAAIMSMSSFLHNPHFHMSRFFISFLG